MGGCVQDGGSCARQGRRRRQGVYRIGGGVQDGRVYTDVYRTGQGWGGGGVYRTGGMQDGRA
jgi:hypothetical protein